MGHKVNPIGLRLGINRNWDSRWFPGFKTMPENIGEDYKIRTFLKKELYYAGVASIIIERTAKRLRVTIVAARPGIIIGKKGADIEKLKSSLIKLIGKDIAVNIKEEKKAQASAQLVAENVATQLERRIAFRRAMKKVIQGAQRSGAKGIKISVAGRLGGAEMARTEWYLEDVFLFIHFVQRLITVSLKLILHTELSVLKYGSSKGKFLLKAFLLK